MKELLEAAAAGNLSKVRDFIENKGCSVNTQAKVVPFQSSVLHEAALHLEVEVVRYLLEKGGDANLPVADTCAGEPLFSNWTPLHAVAVNHSFKKLAGEDIAKAEAITTLLLEHGANPHAKVISFSSDFDGKTASQIANQSGSYAVAAVINEFVEKSSKPILEKAATAHIPSVNSAEVFSTDPDKNNASYLRQANLFYNQAKEMFRNVNSSKAKEAYVLFGQAKDMYKLFQAIPDSAEQQFKEKRIEKIKIKMKGR